MWFVLLESLLYPLVGTALGAGCVFFGGGDAGRGPARFAGFLERTLVGLSAGVMTAASFFSLLLPAIESDGGLFPSVVGVVAGICLLSVLDRFLCALSVRRADSGATGRTYLTFLALFLHNIPEGMAVGAILAGFFSGGTGRGEVLALTLGIAVQNFPDGAIVSLPFCAAGMSRAKAFWFGVLSGAVEPVFAVLTFFLSGAIAGLLPYFLAFAAGAMLYVVVRELIPKMESGEKTGMPAFTVGFILLVLLDRFFAG